jgi:hypothetical protein
VEIGIIFTLYFYAPFSPFQCQISSTKAWFLGLIRGGKWIIFTINATFAKSSFCENNYLNMARQTRQFPQGKYVLRTPHVTQDGQVYAVYMYYYWKGKQIRRSVDFFVTQKDWNQEANGGAGEFRPSYGPNYKERNAYL